MLKKKLGLEVIEKCWLVRYYFKIPTTLTIPEGCEKISDFAFCGCEKLEKVEIPESVEWIGDWAFFGCTDIDIILRKPESEFKYIGRNALFSYRNVKEETGN